MGTQASPAPPVRPWNQVSVAQHTQTPLRAASQREPPELRPCVPPRCPTAGTPVVPFVPLVRSLRAWLALPSLSRWLIQTIRLGYAIQFARRPPKFRGVHFTSVKAVDTHVLRAEIAVLLAKEAIELVPPADMRSGFYSPYFIVPKKSGGLRPILDLRVLNRSLHKLPFKMLMQKRISECVRPRDWFAAIDLDLFVKWCSSRREDPRRCSIGVVLSFLQQGLERRLSPSTLKVHAAAISAYHDHIDGKSIGKHDLVVRFLRGARQLNPPRPPSIPSWDLALVLRALQIAPFEPLQSADLRILSMKTLLLVALASIKRVGDLQAFSVDESCLEFGPGDGHMLLSPRPGYVPKVPTTPFRDQVVSLQALPLEEADPALALLCPVRALRLYTRSGCVPTLREAWHPPGRWLVAPRWQIFVELRAGRHLTRSLDSIAFVSSRSPPVFSHQGRGTERYVCCCRLTCSAPQRKPEDATHLLLIIYPRCEVSSCCIWLHANVHWLV